MSNLSNAFSAVGADIKRIDTALAQKADKTEVASLTPGITQEQLNTAIAQAKSDLIGGGNVDGGIISKLTEIGNRVTAIENEDFLSAYTTAKNTL